jgi:PAS domain-containing protein
MTDITEQKQAEQDLAKKEAQFRVALGNMPGAGHVQRAVPLFRLHDDLAKTTQSATPLFRLAADLFRRGIRARPRTARRGRHYRGRARAISGREGKGENQTVCLIPA